MRWLSSLVYSPKALLVVGTIVPCHQVKEVVSLRVTFEDKLRIYKNAQRHIGRFHAQFPRQHDTRYLITMLGWSIQNQSIYHSELHNSQTTADKKIVHALIKKIDGTIVNWFHFSLNEKKDYDAVYSTKIIVNRTDYTLIL